MPSRRPSGLGGSTTVADGTVLEAREPDAHAAAAAPPLLGRGDVRPSAEELRAMLAAHSGNIASVAAAYGRDRKQIYRWARRYGLDVDGFRDEPERED